jgi:hypothetical protein
MNNQISSKTIALTFGVLVILFSAGFYIFAWQEPNQAPPSGNASTPINTSATAQTKTGDLTVGISQIKADGSVGTNLNSDKIDDYHAADLMAAGGGGGAVNCQIICNGTCPTAPAGWTLTTSVGKSGGSYSYNSMGVGFAAAAGRCAYNNGGSSPLLPGTETMCCYFHTPN